MRLEVMSIRFVPPRSLRYPESLSTREGRGEIRLPLTPDPSPRARGEGKFVAATVNPSPQN